LISSSAVSMPGALADFWHEVADISAGSKAERPSLTVLLLPSVAELQD